MKRNATYAELNADFTWTDCTGEKIVTPKGTKIEVQASFKGMSMLHKGDKFHPAGVMIWMGRDLHPIIPLDKIANFTKGGEDVTARWVNAILK